MTKIKAFDFCFDVNKRTSLSIYSNIPNFKNLNPPCNYIILNDEKLFNAQASNSYFLPFLAR